MSELTTIARPYAKAAFDFAVEQNTVEKWANMLHFSSELIKDETMQTFLKAHFLLVNLPIQSFQFVANNLINMGKILFG